MFLSRELLNENVYCLLEFVSCRTVARRGGGAQGGLLRSHSATLARHFSSPPSYQGLAATISRDFELIELSLPPLPRPARNATQLPAHELP